MATEPPYAHLSHS